MEAHKKSATRGADNLKRAMEAVAEGMPVRAVSKTFLDVRYATTQVLDQQPNLWDDELVWTTLRKENFAI